MHDPRGKVGVGLGYATNEAGADHLVGFHDPLFVKPDSLPFHSVADLGISEPTGVLDLGEKKVRIWHTSARWNSASPSSAAVSGPRWLPHTTTICPGAIAASYDAALVTAAITGRGTGSVAGGIFISARTERIAVTRSTTQPISASAAGSIVGVPM